MALDLVGAARTSSIDFDRVPPHDDDAEKSVLGGMLLSKDAISDVIEVLRDGDFYRPNHQLIYDVITDLYSRGDPADPITVSARLTRDGTLERAGGVPYLHTLASGVPTAANASYYAQIVRDRAILRRLVEAGTRVVQYGYAGTGEDVDDLVDRAQAEVYAVTERRTSEDYVRLEPAIDAALAELDAISGGADSMAGVPTGFRDLDKLTNGLHSSQLIVLAARPAIGKSTLGLDLARAAAIKNGQTTVIFSLEMNRSEITMRLLSAEARVALHLMRTGKMTEEDWRRMARASSEVRDAPLYIDDSPNLTMMEIRAKARRLKQRNDLRLVIVDYLQLMSSPRRIENRQQEVSEISRSMKLLAKELEVPVVAISQLNRGPEQRTDKKPMLSDLRESGCLTAATRIVRADTGAMVTLGELHAAGATDVPVWSLDDSLRYVRRILTHVFPTGHREVLRLTTRSGRRVEATANHPLLTFDGWRAAGDLAVGDRVGVVRHLPAPGTPAAQPDVDVVLAGHAVGTGCASALVTGAGPLATAELGRVATLAGGYLAGAGSQRLLVGLDPALQRVAEATRGGHAVPSWASSLTTVHVRRYLRQLWWAAGGERPGGVATSIDVAIRAVADDVALLLTRIGMAARITERPDGRCILDVGDDQGPRLADEFGIGSAAAPTRESADDIPADLWSRLRDVMATPTAVRVATAPRNGKAKMAALADAFAAHDMDVEATNDLSWDPIVAIEPIGTQDVFDATVLGTHNFIAEGLAVHNSIEQDADMVILLHREDAYDKESPRAGEADLIVAKHRNGPTQTLQVAFQGHYSRFVDMNTSS